MKNISIIVFQLIMLIELAWGHTDTAQTALHKTQSADGDCIGSPVDVMLVIDTSSSMAGTPLQNEKMAAVGFVNRMNLNQDQIGLVSFSDYSSLDYILTHDGVAVKNAVQNLSYGYLTNISAGINTAQAELVGTHHNPVAPSVMLLMSDGQPTVDTVADALAAATAAKNQGTRIFTIGLGTTVNSTLLQNIASYASDYYYAPSSSDLASIYQSIANIVTCTSGYSVYLPVIVNAAISQVYDEANVRYILADSQLGNVIDYYRQFPNDLNAVEAVRRWDAGIRVANITQFERKIVNGQWQVVYAGTDTLINGMDVVLIDEGSVRYILADSQLGNVIDYYRQFPNDLNAVEAVRRWDAGIRVANITQFERKIVNGQWQVVYAGTDTLINGMDVILTSDL